MKTFGLAGWSGSGKTTLMIALLAELRRRGIAAATIKHTHHHVQIDRPEDESRLFRAAGAIEALTVAPRAWSLIHEFEDERAMPLEAAVAALGAVDLVLVEGFKRHPHPKIEVHDPALGKPLLAPEDPHVVALACDAPPVGVTVPVFARDDIAGIADFILRRVGLG